MKLFIAAMLTFFVLVQSQSYGTTEEPAYILDLVKNQPKNKTFEVRIYEPSTWVVTNYRGGRWAHSQAFMSLFYYIQGQNSQGAVIPMTAPVLTTFDKPQCYRCERVFGMSFYLPKKYQNNPPVPTNPNLRILRSRKTVMYTSKFGGWATKEIFISQERKLRQNLRRNGITDKMINLNRFYGASYDSPMRIFNRRNEVWIEGISNN